MIAAALLCALTQAPLGPDIQAGASEAFLKSAMSVQEKLASGDFAGAKSVIDTLPKLEISVEWDDSKVPSSRKAEFSDARDRALNAWQLLFPGFRWHLANPGDLRISFAESLPKAEGQAFPPGAVQFVSDSAKEPRIEIVIALKRGAAAEASEALDVHNEVAFALASYYGIAPTPYYDSFSWRTDQPNRNINRPRPGELYLAKCNLEVVDELRKMANAKLKVTPAKPQLVMDPKTIDGGSHVQGDVPSFSIQISNIGNAPLRLYGIPDCGCVFAPPPAQIEAGQTVLLKVRVDTTEFVGDLKKVLTFFSNDVNAAVTTVPVRVFAKPLFRWLSPSGDTALLGSNGASHDVYFVPAEGVDLKPLAAKLDGVSGTVKVQPWSGTLADPEMGEGPKPRKGYKFSLHYDPGAPPGRMFSTLVIRTNAKEALKENSDKFALLQYNVAVQKGIVALPDQLYFNEIPRIPRRVFFIVSRPGKPFKITKAEADEPYFKLSWKAVKEDWEYRVTVDFDGNADPGLLRAKFRVVTDDKEQPVLEIPFRAVLR